MRKVILLLLGLGVVAVIGGIWVAARPVVSVVSIRPQMPQTIHRNVMPVPSETPLTLKVTGFVPSIKTTVKPDISLRPTPQKPTFIGISLCSDNGVYRPDGLARKFSEKKAARDGIRALPVDCGMIKTSIPFSF